MADAARLVDAHVLHDWMHSQRWFGGKGREWTVGNLELVAELRGAPDPLHLYVVTVLFADGQEDAYQLMLSLRREPSDLIGHVLLGEGIVDLGDGVTYWIYDGFHDKEAMTALYRRLREGGQVGSAEFHPLPAARELPADAVSHVLSGEQSNTSVVFGGLSILKAFRKLAPSVSPDIEVHEALQSVGCAQIAAPVAHVNGRWAQNGRQVEGSLAMMQEFLAGASGGWELAQASVRDLFAEGDLHADEVGGDFAAESWRLGEATAKVHRDLTRALPTQTWGPEQLSVLADAMLRRLETAARDVPELAAYAAPLAERYRALARRTAPVEVQRIHGDYHLGQVMRTAQGWRLLDFEGEPAKPLEERRALDSPVRDVAGMLRSFDYAARFQLMDRPRDAQLEYRATEWAERNRGTFCVGYASVSGADPRDEEDLLAAYEADKAVYELMYEARNRPGWVRIPLGAIERLSSAVPST